MPSKKKTGRRSFLTKQQINVLRLRRKGLTQEAIAKKLGTSRANITILEKRGMENISKAHETLRIWHDIEAPISIHIRRGTDVFKIPDMLFETADISGIKVNIGSVELVAKISEEKHVVNRRLQSDMDIFVSEEGDIDIQ